MMVDQKNQASRLFNLQVSENNCFLVMVFFLIVVNHLIFFPILQLPITCSANQGLNAYGRTEVDRQALRNR